MATETSRRTVPAAVEIGEPPIARLLFADTRSSWFWLLVRLYAGWAWPQSGMKKVGNGAWTGANAGGAIGGFVNGALHKTGGTHPDVTGWYAARRCCAASCCPIRAHGVHLIAYGEVLVGVGLIFGVLTGISAFFRSLMNVNYLLAGTVSSNPILFVARHVAGACLAGRRMVRRGWLLPRLGTPWAPGPTPARTAPRASGRTAAT